MSKDFDIAAGMAWLAENNPHMAMVIDHVGVPASRHRAGGFATLLKIIVEQQVSTASAAAIWKRLEDHSPVTVERVHAHSEEELRGFGLSRPKIRYAKSLAENCVSGAFSFEELETLPPLEAHERLLALKGIGRWSAEIYRMFALGHADIWPSGDIALQEGVKRALELQDRPVGEELDRIAMDWSPWRSVAALLVWKYYHDTGGPSGKRNDKKS